VAAYWFDPTVSPRMLLTTPSPRVRRALRSIATIQACSGRSEMRSAPFAAGPPVNNVDFALHKVLPVGEGKRFEFRAEFFNLLNHAQFNNPDGNTTDGSDFGRILRAKAPRQIQIGVEVLLLAGSGRVGTVF